VVEFGRDLRFAVLASRFREPLPCGKVAGVGRDEVLERLAFKGAIASFRSQPG
jgi:hypothetical protein